MCVLAAVLAAGCGSEDESKDTKDSTTKEPASVAADAPEESTDESSSEDAAPSSTEEPVAEEAPAQPKATTFEVTIASGQPKGGPQVWRAKKGDRVRITVSSDTADELHLHGYDVSKDVASGGSATLELVADTTGSFELELEHAGTLVGNLEVR